MYGIGGQLLEGIRSFYENASASVQVNGELSESFNIEVGVRQGCVMSPWLFNIYMDGCVREMKAKLTDLQLPSSTKSFLDLKLSQYQPKTLQCNIKKLLHLIQDPLIYLILTFI